MAVPENGEDLGLYPVDTEEEAREDLAISWPVSAPSTGWTRTELRTRENSVRGRAATLRGRSRMQTSQLELFDSFDSLVRGRAAALPLFFMEWFHLTGRPRPFIMENNESERERVFPHVSSFQRYSASCDQPPSPMALAPWATEPGLCRFSARRQSWWQILPPCSHRRRQPLYVAFLRCGQSMAH